MRGALGGVLTAGLLVCALFACQQGNGPDELRIAAVSPPLGELAGGTSVLVRGSGFTDGVTVRFGDSAAIEVRRQSDTELWAVTPRGPSASAEVAVTVGRSDGAQASWGDRFTYYSLGLTQAPDRLRSPTAVAMAGTDWDRDGRLDVVVLTADPAGVVLLKGEADGSLAYVRRYDVGRRPVGLAAADLDADGAAELLSLDDASGAPAVQILRGRSGAPGELALAVPVALPTTCQPTAIAAGDLDGDRRAEVVVTCQSADAVLLRNLGDRADGLGPRFGAPSALTGGAAPLAAILADLDQDGARDVGILSTAGRLYLHYGDHSGGLLPVQDVPAGEAPRGLVPLDVTEDGKDELLIPDRSGSVLVLKSTGMSLLTRWQRPAAPAGTSLLAPLRSGGATHVLALDGDTGEGARFFLQDANLIKPVPVALGGALAAVLGLDLNADGSGELLALGRTDGALTIYRSVDGSLVRAQTVSLLPPVRGTLAADVDGDGWADLLWIEEGTSAVRVRYSRGDGTFEPAASYPTAAGPAAIGVADLNGDRAPDLVVTCPRAGTTSVLISVAPRSFQSAFDVPSGASPELLALTDVSGDSKADLLVMSAGGGELRVLLGRGNGTLEAPRTVSVGGAARALTVFDSDGDGKRDVLVLGSDGLRVLRGRGDGTFEPAALSEAGEAPLRMASFDTNLDGVRDLAVLAPGELRLLLGRPDGGFTLMQRIPVAPTTRHVAAIDLDRDGDLDVVVAGEQRAEIGILLGRPDGTLLPPVDLQLGLQSGPQGGPQGGIVPSGLLTLDADGDRVTDLIVAGAAGQVLLRGRSQ